jgi:hypothetical protein
MEELAIDLKALDPTGEVNPYILLITNRYKGKSTIICPNIRPKALAKWIIAYKEVREVWWRLTDPRKCYIALLIAGLKETVCRGEVEGPARSTATS